MEKEVMTIAELKEAGIWERVCQINHWDDEFLEHVKLPDDWKISFPKKLLTEKSKGRVQ